MEFEIVPPSLVVKAMQDSGYKNAAYAVAELIDNSIQAGATRVELICLEALQQLDQRKSVRLKAVGVLDNGHGMDANALRTALQFGNGAHLHDRSGIGRFGMGLPNSSMSQGDRVEVWSWKRGVENAVFSYLDLNEIQTGDMTQVPTPKKKRLPAEWKKVAGDFGETGTLVVWANPNRCNWKRAEAFVRNSEEVVGRLYRRFIADGRVSIRLAAYRDEDLVEPHLERDARPNDPGYLIERTSCPEPWNDTSMFEPWGDEFQQVIGVKFRDESHKITVTYSIAKKEARSGHNQGAEPWGKHASRWLLMVDSRS